MEDIYWDELGPIVYENAEAARNVTFKEFMTTHVRKFLPGVYKGLVLEWPALKLWSNIKYFQDRIGSEW